MILNDTILPDIFYVKLEHKDAFLKTVKVKSEISGSGKAHRYPSFTRLGTGRKCDYSGEVFQPEDDIFCVYVLERQTN